MGARQRGVRGRRLGAAHAPDHAVLLPQPPHRRRAHGRRQRHGRRSQGPQCGSKPRPRPWRHARQWRAAPRNGACSAWRVRVRVRVAGGGGRGRGGRAGHIHSIAQRGGRCRCDPALHVSSGASLRTHGLVQAMCHMAWTPHIHQGMLANSDHVQSQNAGAGAVFDKERLASSLPHALCGLQMQIPNAQHWVPMPL